MLTLLDNRNQHVGLLVVRLREAIVSAQRDGAPATESIGSVKCESQASDAPRPALEQIKPAIQYVTPKQDPENDIVELLTNAVCKINAVLHKVPETSEVCVGSILGDDTDFLMQLRPYVNTAWKVMGLAQEVLSRNSHLSSCTLTISRPHRGRLREQRYFTIL